MSIEQTLRAKLTESIKAKDRRTADVIRMIETKVMERRTARDFRGTVDDALYLEVIGAYRKSMAKALEEYEALGERGREQAEQLRFEVDFCARFLPRSLSESEVREAVRKVISDLGASDPKMAGRVMGEVMKQHKGRIDAPVVKRIVDEELR
jgi:uncharacterized protein